MVTLLRQKIPSEKRGEVDCGADGLVAPVFYGFCWFAFFGNNKNAIVCEHF